MRFILNKPMLREIIGVGGFFFLMLLGMLYIFQHAEVNQLTDLLHLQLGAKGHVSTYELTLLFTTFRNDPLLLSLQCPSI